MVFRSSVALSLTALLVLTGCGATPFPTPNAPVAPIVATSSAKVIKHVVVIFGENVSFDHYFGTYPNAANLPNDTSKFTAAAGTPTNINNYVSNPALLTVNPNTSVANGAGATNPYRLDPAQSKAPSTTARWTCFPSRSAPPIRRPWPRRPAPRRFPPRMA
jgi:phospholipase C